MSFHANRMVVKSIPISYLTGRVVTVWQGCEMALAEGKGDGEVRWSDPGIPFLQFANLDLQLDDGQALRLLSQIEDGSGHHGLYLGELNELPALRVFDEPSSIFRERRPAELPIGEIKTAELRQDGSNAVVEIRLLLSGAEIRLVAAEVREEHNGSFRIIEADESILIQLDGARPCAA